MRLTYFLYVLFSLSLVIPKKVLNDFQFLIGGKACWIRIVGPGAWTLKFHIYPSKYEYTYKRKCFENVGKTLTQTIASFLKERKF